MSLHNIRKFLSGILGSARFLLHQLSANTVNFQLKCSSHAYLNESAVISFDI